MATDVLKYIFIAGAVMGGIGAIRAWRLRRWQMKLLRSSQKKPTANARERQG